MYIMEYYSATEKNEIMPFAAAWMQLEIIIPNEVNQREKQIPYNTTYGVQIRTQINLSMKWKTESWTQRTDQ